EVAGEPKIGQPLTVIAARQLGAQILRERAMGQDPHAENRARQQQAKLAAAERASSTFGPNAETFCREYRSPKKRRRPRRWSEVTSCIGYTFKEVDGKPTVTLNKGSLAERWYDKPLAEIDEDGLFLVVREAKQQGIPGILRRVKGSSETRARRMCDALGSFFGWLKAERLIKINPMRDIEWRPAAGGQRKRKLSDAELRWLWRALDEAAEAGEVPQAYAALVRFVLVTATRRDEARLMREGELKGTDWTVPSGRMKGDLDFLVVLSPLARRILDEVPRVVPGLIFSIDGKHALGNLSEWKAAVDARMLALARQEQGEEATIERWGFHDFRRNARTYLSSITTADIAERCIAHKIARTRAHYDLFEYRDQKAHALQAWAREVERIIAGKSAKVIPLKRRKRS